ncbi:protein of unknown function [Nitrospira japonica]|uniref:Uncharacterized protein n=1 Tax=Nitrospira japonica TaxID=1325564 RepID=A0A1W1I845_9BACT|nr:hypothetical protein [Nitrospira japonica]SLM49029.1 protein of unknown function [Nitrospira japonica]
MVLLGHHPSIAETGISDPVSETETVEEQSVESEDEPGSEQGPVDPNAPDGTKRRTRLFKRIAPKNLTPQEEEEAERLRKLAARYGTDPTAIVGRLQLSSQYLDLPQSTHATATVARVDLPFRGNYLLRFDLPFLKTVDPSRPGATNLHGMSDLAITAGWRAYNTPEYAVLIGAVTTMPTAAEPGLGFGKYTVGPALATARFLPRWDSFLIGLVQYQTSVGGDPSRQNVSFLNTTAQLNSFWGRHWWTILNAVLQVNFEQNAKSSMTVEFEGGRNLVGTLGAYVRPGVGIWGRDLPGAYIWNIEMGVRYMFKTF